ncbi:50S ribosomal protein L21 [Camelimonas abortus]|uniref:Large ribosomal subunit protein bL21 n=1 Tax=Camelimonas abortus TaxID=1017184 RepID=A0ABV7LBN5_9HYPH
MFAVIRAGGKQYRVAAGDTITIDRQAGEPGDALRFEVLLVGEGESFKTGAEAAGASAEAVIVSHGRGPKVIAFKKRRRQNSKRKRGHRQDYTLVRITGINA